MGEKRLEREFILELCKVKTYKKERIISLMQKELDYPYILGHLLFHRVGGVAFYVLKQCDLLAKVNREFRNVLQTIYRDACQKADSYVKSMEDLAEILKEFNSPYAVLKGALLVSIYERGLRTSNDFDILLQAKNITELSNLLKENGFVQGHIRSGEFKAASRSEIIMSRMNRGETVPFIKEINLPSMKYCEIDLNFSLDFQAKQYEAVLSKMLSNTKPNIKLANENLQTLDLADFLIHLCAHLYKEATVINWVKMGRDISLYKYIDIYLFIHMYMDNAYAERLAQRIKAYGLEKECYYAFYYTKELLNVDNMNLDKLLTQIKPTNTVFMKQIIDPANGKIYQFNEEYIPWVFNSNRGGCLYEATDEATQF